MIEDARRCARALEVIRDLQDRLGGQPGVEALCELVGERIEAIFDSQALSIAIYDREADLLRFPYAVERGERLPDEPVPPSGRTRQVIETSRPLQSSSALLAPLITGGELSGVIAIENPASGRAFGDADLEHLSSIAAGLGMALEVARLAEARRETERRYRHLVEGLPMTVYMDEPVPEATSIYISPQVEDLAGYPQEEWLTDPELFPKLLHPDDRARVLADMERVFAESERGWSDEYRLIARDGRSVWIRDEAVVVKDEQGKPLYVQGFLVTRCTATP